MQSDKDQDRLPAAPSSDIQETIKEVSMTPAVNDEREVSETKEAAAEAPKYEHPNWIPPELRRPEDEFVDLTQI